MRADTVTKLSLDRWAQIMGIHPLHFAGVTLATLAPSAGCSSPWLQHAWQGGMVQDADRMGREEIAMAIRQAEDGIERQLKFRLQPTWEEDEWRPTIRPNKPEMVNLSGTDVKGYHSIVPANWGHFISGGIESKVAIPNPTAIVWSDVDGDGYDETGTVTVVTSVTNPCEIAIHYPGKLGADEWEIRPTNVTIALGTATIVFQRHLAVLENLQEALVPTDVDGATVGNFLTEVEVYRHWNDPQIQATLAWEPLPGVCSCGNITCPACSYSSQTGCLIVRGDPKDSMVAFQPASWDAENNQFIAQTLTVSRQPDIISLHYYAGFRNKTMMCPGNKLDTMWEQVVAAYAASLVSRTICDCERARANFERWQIDLAYTTGATQIEAYSISPEDLDNPFGTRVGAVFAWKRVKDYARGIAVYA